MIAVIDQIAAATARQRQAVKPAASVWVSASAGTGKTKVLTDRLLALMLDGTDPARILCLTFTRAAAAEMANRVNQRLAAWTTLPPGKLAEQLTELTGQYPSEYETARARQLFARVLDAPGGAKIATIHAFCQSLLRRFSLEAGVSPEFVVIDERSAADALAEAGESVIATARAGRQPEIAAALQVVAAYAAEDNFAELIGMLARERGKLRSLAADGVEGLRGRLDAALGIPPGATPEALAEAFCGGGDLAGLRSAAAALAAGSPTDRLRGLMLERWCEDPGARRGLLDDYVSAFLTEKGEIRDVLITKPAAKAALGDPCLGDPCAVLQAEAQRVLCYTEQRAGAALAEATAALTRIGAAVLDSYEQRKRRHGQLDYDDLVLKTTALLRRPGVAPWVLFKLDGGLDHILIDEAQDTNPEQWEIVAALAAEFFAGHGANARNRTVFAVGDAKQSIYSFQRADPGAFLAMQRHFQDRVAAAKQDWLLVPLEISFRAAPPLLCAVDAVFRHQGAADGVALDGTAIRHVAARTGHAGLVELWPPVLPRDEDIPEAGDYTEIRRSPEPRTRLARAIAATIAQWLESGERLASRDRPLRPGDIMVLVRRRNRFVADLLRALKQRGVPVAGADRLVLTDQLAVQDLVALGRFLLLPEDDLTLATVLKGPLFGLSEEELFLLAYGRGEQKLWRRLPRLAREYPNMQRALDRLVQLRARADFVPPFELFAEVLGAGGGRHAMLERLGPEAADPIDEFLAQALAYEREHAPSLQGFLHWLAAGEIEVKRDFGEHQRDELRILTVHGAKGLEAPVVFLPDTMQLPDRRQPLIWSEAAGLPLWCPRSDFAAPFYVAERQAQRRRHLQEYRRLLYVALTRAQDRLYVCGWQTRNPTREAASWHTLCDEGWRQDADTPFEAMPFDTRPLLGERDGWSGEAWRLTGPQTATPRGDAAMTALAAARPRPQPGWVALPPAPEPDPPKPLLPSRPSGPEPATLSPLAVAGRDRFKRGLLVHRLLQSLPELAPPERAAAATRFLALPLHRLGPEEQQQIAAETLAVLADPEFAELWGPEAQAEVPVVGLVEGQALSGQIDRLLVTAERVLIVDYKTLRPPPPAADEVPALYLRQMAAYRAAVARIYPDRRVECAILWTEGPRLMPLAAALLDRHRPA